MLANIILGLVSIAVLILSAEYVVNKLIDIAQHYGVSHTFMGLTVLSLGTSLPEIASHLVASFGILSGKLDYTIASSTVLGANIGSDVVQQTLVLGIVIFIIGSITFSKSFLKKSYSVMVGTTLLTLILGWDQHISRLDGLILFGTFIAYILYLYSTENKTKIKKKATKTPIAKNVLLTLLGLVVLLISSIIVLNITEYIVIQTGIGGSLIGVLTLGIASALPEMFTAIIGIKKKATGISLGTLIGSNITNPLVAIGLGGMISTYYVPKPLIYWDLPMETISALLLLLYLVFTKRKLGRKGAVYLIALYFVYATIRIMFFAID
jgi:cation:H+ antiporter